MKLKWILFPFFIALVSCSTNQTVSKGTVNYEPAGITTGDGLWYSLPKTVIRVELIAEKVVVRPGPFYRYSQRLLNIADVETESRDEWRIVGANISTVGVPDGKRQYRISSNGNPSLAALNLTSNGVIAGVNLSDFSEPAVKPDVKEEIISLAQVQFNDVPFSEEQLIKSSTGAMAEEVAKEIYRLRELRNKILKGELESLPPDKDSYQLVLTEIERQEKAFMELFTGKVVVQTIKQNFDFIPVADQSFNTVLLRFSNQNGFLDPLDVSGTPVYIEVAVDTDNYHDFVADETSKSLNTSGLIYCKPVTADVKIIDRTLLLIQQKVQLAQFGQILRMPADLLNGPGVGVEMDLSTGAVKKIFNK